MIYTDSDCAFRLLKGPSTKVIGEGSFAGATFADQTKLRERKWAAGLLQRSLVSGLKSGIVDVRCAPLAMYLVS
jgi:hypothetical protein